MTQMVQAKCPHCQNVLRIPAEWVSKAMRCKHCKKNFQAKANSSTSANVPVAAPASAAKKSAPIPIGRPANTAPVAVAAESPPASSGNPFGLEQDEPSAPTSTARTVRRGKGRGLLLLLLMFFFLFVLGAGGAGFVVYKALTIAPFGDWKQVAKQDGNKSDSAPIKPNSGPDYPAADGPNGSFPRRALLISVNNYLFYNTVHYGSDVNELVQGYPGSSTKVLRDRFTRPPMNFPATQVKELSDGIPKEQSDAALPDAKVTKAHSTQKSVLETTIKDFVDSSRRQDRIILFFAGHAACLEDKSYLVPIDGNLKDVESLVPLKWIYDQLASCKAQQKILILDVFRFSPSRGFELPSTGDGDEGAMPEGFDKDVLNPPAGVQVWCSCQKEQNAVELEGGSAFMQALCNSLQGGAQMKGLSAPNQPIPVEERVKDVNERLRKLLGPENRTQISRLTGTASPAVVAYNKDEPLPAPISLKAPRAAGGDAAPITQVNSILEFFKDYLPPVRETRSGDRNLLDASKLPAFAARKLDSYKPDGYKDLAELQKRYASNKEEFAKEFPVRAAVFDAVEALQASNKIKMFEVQRSPVTQERKNNIRQEQELLGMSTFNLEKALADLKAAGEERDKETSKRWQANFDYTRARLQSRLVYLIEYNYVLSRVRADDLPELATGQTGWRVGTGKKIAVNEAKAKDIAKDTRKLWDKITSQYPDTPWSLLAQREKEITLGLQWRPMSD